MYHGVPTRATRRVPRRKMMLIQLRRGLVSDTVLSVKGSARQPMFSCSAPGGTTLHGSAEGASRIPEDPGGRRLKSLQHAKAGAYCLGALTPGPRPQAGEG